MTREGISTYTGQMGFVSEQLCAIPGRVPGCRRLGTHSVMRANPRIPALSHPQASWRGGRLLKTGEGVLVESVQKKAGAVPCGRSEDEEGTKKIRRKSSRPDPGWGQGGENLAFALRGRGAISESGAGKEGEKTGKEEQGSSLGRGMSSLQIGLVVVCSALGR